jgi:hypothetical protein
MRRMMKMKMKNKKKMTNSLLEWKIDTRGKGKGKRTKRRQTDDQFTESGIDGKLGLK